MCTANYADQVPDFVQDRAEFINIEFYTYPQRANYVMNMLKRKLSKNNRTRYASEQLTEEFCKYVVVEAWGLRQTNANMENIYKVLRGYAKLGNAIANFTQFERVEESKTRFVFKYSGGQVLSLVRLRTRNSEGQSVMGSELGLDWPEFGFSEVKEVVTK